MSKRKQCAVCEKALAACICQQITVIDSDIELIILQHPTEVKNAIGTARILNLSLPQCQIIIGEDFTVNTQLNKILNDPQRECFLLYPGESSVSVEELRSTAITKPKRTFILLDGTWRKAYKMYQSSVNLHAIAAIKLDAEQVSKYTIRQTSIEGGLSTVEAGCLLLSTLDENPQKYKPLLTAFEYMINFQISQMPKGLFKKHYI